MRRLIYRFRNPHNIESGLRTPSISALLPVLSHSNCRRSVYRRHGRKETQVVLVERELLEICGEDSGVSVKSALRHNSKKRKER